MDKRKPLALIPARGGSKRFPRKNIAALRGKPLLAWSIEPALQSGIFDHVWVTSEDQEILAVAEAWGGAPLARSPELAGDLVALEPVCLDAVRRLAETHPGYTDIFLMLPTSPFRRPEVIAAAWRAFLESGADSLMSLAQLTHPPQWALRLQDDRWLFPNDEKGFYTERALLEPLYRHDGAYYLSRIEKFLETGVLMGPKTIPWRVSRMESVDIDDPIDLAWAEFLLERGD